MPLYNPADDVIRRKEARQTLDLIEQASKIIDQARASMLRPKDGCACDRNSTCAMHATAWNRLIDAEDRLAAAALALIEVQQ